MILLGEKFGKIRDQSRSRKIGKWYNFNMLMINNYLTKLLVSFGIIWEIYSKHEKKPKPIKGLGGMYSLKRLS